MILAVNGPTVSDYAEHDCADDLSARTFVYRIAVERYHFTRSEAQDACINASRAFRRGQSFKLNGWTFTLSPERAS